MQSGEHDFHMKMNSNSRRADGRSQEQCTGTDFRNLSQDNDYYKKMLLEIQKYQLTTHNFNSKMSQDISIFK